MTYAMTLDNSWELMTEEEMYDVNGGFLGWSGTTFLNNMVVIAKTIFSAVAGLLGTVFAVGLAKSMNLVTSTGVGWHEAMSQVSRNIVQGTVKSAKAWYTLLSASWGWTLGVLAVTLLVGTVALGYITL